MDKSELGDLVVAGAPAPVVIVVRLFVEARRNRDVVARLEVLEPAVGTPIGSVRCPFPVDIRCRVFFNPVVVLRPVAVVVVSNDPAVARRKAIERHRHGPAGWTVTESVVKNDETDTLRAVIEEQITRLILLQVACPVRREDTSRRGLVVPVVVERTDGCCPVTECLDGIADTALTNGIDRSLAVVGECATHHRRQDHQQGYPDDEKSLQSGHQSRFTVAVDGDCWRELSHSIATDEPQTAVREVLDGVILPVVVD
ncbi:hypothetical protein [Haloferax mediterranei]|uniref:Uncharacterized protein n=1 Tax=Haloferax mediterranei (strain ATCC 33500 / DSM 1411 / JCM 8866 / NBRC 14739 / NCIMB 2177 / R-4) TaxID=523841 RepID=M0IUP6_HALMT|nr:hypothetical protein [Haloferax mediterranei]ELZ99787.1 hypothetical protein C439_12464 [Haloferax mediterranei ATCC 33500]